MIQLKLFYYLFIIFFLMTKYLAIKVKIISLHHYFELEASIFVCFY